MVQGVLGGLTLGRLTLGGLTLGGLTLDDLGHPGVDILLRDFVLDVGFIGFDLPYRSAIGLLDAADLWRQTFRDRVWRIER